MPADEPTGWELQRLLTLMREDVQTGFTGLHSRMDRMVTTDLFAAYQAGNDRRLGELEKDIAALAQERKDDKLAEEKRREVEKERQATERRWRWGLAAGILVPIGLQLFSLIRELFP